MSAPVWFRLLGAPVRNFVLDDSALPFITPGEAVHRILFDTGVLRSDSDGQTPNITVTLDNDADQATRLFRLALPPLGRLGEIRNRHGVIYSGQVKSIDFSDDCQINLQS